MRKLLSVLTFTLLSSQSLTHAQMVTWDGGDPASPNADGNWNATANWDTGALPTTADLTILPSVTDGSTRTVTQDIAAGTTVNALQLTQSAPTGVNELSLSGNLILSRATTASATVDSTNSAFRVTLGGGATVSQVEVDLNGFTISAPTPSGSSIGINIGGTVNFNSANSSIVLTGGGNTTINVFGDLNATADGRIGRDNGATQNTEITPSLFRQAQPWMCPPGYFPWKVQGGVPPAITLLSTIRGRSAYLAGQP